MTGASKIVDRVLERIHYIHFPKAITPADVSYLESRMGQWKKLDIEVHVMDFTGMTAAPGVFFRAIEKLSATVHPRRLVSLNMTEGIHREVVKLKLEPVFNLIKLFPQDLYPKKKIGEPELKRLLIRYLIRAAYSAIEVALNSTVQCDENYVAKAERVPYSQFDLISVIDVNNDFLKAQFRLCSSAGVLKRAASAMLNGAPVDEETVESMASELLNLIYGQAKSHLNDQEGFSLPAAIPRLVRKDQFTSIRRSDSAQHLSILPLVTPLGSFYVEVDTGVPA
jgi:CheY-specific phosphatase CheX